MSKRTRPKLSRFTKRPELRDSRSVLIVYLAIRLLVVGVLIRSLVTGEYESVYTCVLTLVLLMLPDMVEWRLGIKLPSGLEITLVLFIFAAEILGELDSFYVRVQGWDTLLHTISGFIYAAVGFCMVDLLNENKRISFSLSPLFMTFVAFCFSMTIGVLWEFFEFGVDQLFARDMQKDTVIHTIVSVALDPTNSNIPVTVNGIKEVLVNGQSLGLGGYLDIGLIDTMRDLLVNFAGAVVFCIIGYFYVKHRRTGKLASMFVPRVLEKPANDAAGGTENVT